MPEQAIDWSGIRASAVLIGVREAARQAAQDLPYNEQERFVERVMKRSSREGWLVRKAQDLSAVMAAPDQYHAKALSAPVRTGAELLSEGQNDYRKRNNYAITKASCLASEHLSALPAADILERVPELVGLAKAVATANPEQGQPSTVVNLAFIQNNG